MKAVRTASGRSARRPRGGNSTVPRSRLYLGALVTAALIVAVLVAASQLGGGKESRSPTAVAGAGEAFSLLDGIPQDGIALGDPNAPVTLVEYADLQCPFCAQWARDALPAIVDEYVRPGKVRLVFHGLAFIGPESDAALRAALAAGEQKKLWQVVELLYRNQGAENGGWVTDELLAGIGAAVPGLDVERMLADRSSAAVAGTMAEAARHADDAGVRATPSFQAGPRGEPLERLELRRLDAASMRAALDALLGT